MHSILIIFKSQYCALITLRNTVASTYYNNIQMPRFFCVCAGCCAPWVGITFFWARSSMKTIWYRVTVSSNITKEETDLWYFHWHLKCSSNFGGNQNMHDIHWFCHFLLSLHIIRRFTMWTITCWLSTRCEIPHHGSYECGKCFNCVINHGYAFDYI